MDKNQKDKFKSEFSQEITNQKRFYNKVSVSQSESISSNLDR